MIIERKETKKHISRKTAQKMIQEMLEKIPSIDAMDSWTRIAAIIVFGSYLDDKKNKLGDVDVIVLNEWKPEQEMKAKQILDKNGVEGISRTFEIREIFDREMNIMAHTLRGQRRFFQFHTYMTLPELIAHNKRENKPFQYDYLFLASPEIKEKYESALNSWVQAFIEKPDRCVI